MKLSDVKLNDILMRYEKHQPVMYKVNGLMADGSQIFFQRYYGKKDAIRFTMSKIYTQMKSSFGKTKWLKLNG